jgi:hypothetical protein
MTDPLEIINRFMDYTEEIGPCPIDVNNRYWLRKLCALAERCAYAENNNQKLQEKLKQREILTVGEQIEIKKYLHYYCHGGEIDLNSIAHWIKDLEETRREHKKCNGLLAENQRLNKIIQDIITPEDMESMLK